MEEHQKSVHEAAIEKARAQLIKSGFDPDRAEKEVAAEAVQAAKSKKVLPSSGMKGAGSGIYRFGPKLKRWK